MEVVTLNLIAKVLSIDNESCLLHELEKYCSDFPHLINPVASSMTPKVTSELCEKIRRKVAQAIEGKENDFCIGSKSIEVCRPVKGRLGRRRGNFKAVQNFGYCASQRIYYYGHELHVCCL